MIKMLLLANSLISTDAICTGYGDLAYEIMSLHQSGVSLSKTLQAVGDEPIVRKMIIIAYDMSRYPTEEMRRETAEWFRDRMMLACLEQRK